MKVERRHAQWSLAIMAKQPAAGHTKTRLIPRLGAEQAARFYEQLLLDTIDRVTQISLNSDCAGYVAIDEPESAEYFTATAPDMPQVVQVGASLGDRLDSVLRASLAVGHAGAFAIGSDSPDVPAAYFASAFAELARPDVDIVLGPATDGGYYLIGWKQPWPQVVTDVQMSTSTVLTDTLAVAKRIGARVALIDEWHDLDEPGDLDAYGALIDGALAPRTATFLSGLAAR